MAKSAAVVKAADEEKKVTGTAVAEQKTHLPAGFDASEMEGVEGAGTSGAAADNIVPFLALLQDNSPQVKKRDPAYVEGAEPGDVYNSATRELWKVGDPEAAPLVVIPCYFDQWIVEWVPRDQGGGFISRHPLGNEPVEATLARLGKQVPDPRDSTGKKMIWRTDSGHDLVHTRYHYCLHMTQSGVILPVVIGFASTGHTQSRQWMTQMRQPLPGTSQVPPAWFRKYRVRNAEKKNDQGSWFVLDVNLHSVDDDKGFVTDRVVRDMGRALYEGLKAGSIRAGDEAPAQPTEGNTSAI